MRSMTTFQGPLVAYRQVIAADLAIAESRRLQRRESYNASVREVLTQWKEQSGYKLGPMINDQLVRRHFAAWLGVAFERELMTLASPLFLTMQAMERSLHHVSIYASPSGNGPERYAPKPRGTMPQQVRVGVCHG